MLNNDIIEKLKREAEEEDQSIAKAICIERDFRPLVTVYNQVTGFIVAEVERHSANLFERRLFFRHSSERSYRPLAPPAPDINYDHLITSPTHPAVYYTVTHVTKGEKPGEYSGDWLSVDRFDLTQLTTDTIISKGQLQTAKPILGRLDFRLVRRNRR